MANLQDTTTEDALFALRLAAQVAAIADPAERLRTLARFRGVRLVDLARQAGIPYTRLETGLNGRRSLHPPEIELLSRILRDPGQKVAAR